MHLHDVSNILFSVASNGLVPLGGSEGEIWCDDNFLAFSSAFNAITAAFATLGYYMQSDLIYMILNTKLGTFAPLLYILSAAAGLVSMVLGMPWKNYVWFMMGPGIYAWLIGTPAYSHGVAWMIGNEQQDQTQVWKNAEVGLRNSTFVARVGTPIYGDKPPEEPARVAYPFVFYDALLSSTVRYLVEWTGVTRQFSRDSFGSGETNLNLQFPGPLSSGGECGGDADNDPQYAVMTNLKWTYLHSIASAKVASPDLRDSFVRFMVSECGDRFNQAIDPSAYIAASNSGGKTLPETIFKTMTTGQGGQSGEDYRVLRSLLAQESVPVPRSMRNFFSNRYPVADTGFAYDFPESVKWDYQGSGGGNADNVIEYLFSDDRISCDAYLDILILAFRYEATAIYVQTFGNNLPKGWESFHAVYNMLYGWALPTRENDLLSTWDQERYVQDLILVHLFRNEYALVPKQIENSKSNGQIVIQNAEAYNRSVGSVNKFAEIYTWALMLPYLQGILLYFLAMMYPVACLLIVVPGWHKFLITWASFFAWAKLWDLGFAVVASLERSVWAMLGNDANMEVVNQRIMNMQDYGAGMWAGCYNGQNPGDHPACSIPDIVLVNSAVAPGTSPVNFPFSGRGMVDSLAAHMNNLHIFDNALTVGLNLNFDLANGYYIYIMAALYFAVPAVTGQLVLGARAGASSMVGQFTGSASQHAGSGAQMGFQGEQTQRLLSDQASVGQAALAKGYRQSGMAHQAMQAENSSAGFALKAGAHDQAAQGEGRLQNAETLNIQSAQAQQALGSSILRAALGLSGGPSNSKLGRGTDNVGANDVGAKKHDSAGSAGGETTRSDGGEVAGMSGSVPTHSAGGSGSDGGPTAQHAGAVANQLTGGGGGGGTKGVGGAFSGAGGVVDAMPSSMLDIADRAYGAEMQSKLAHALNKHSAAAGGQQIAGFGASQMGNAYGQSARRMQQAAGFDAASARYDTMQKMAHQLASNAAIAGYMIGGMNPGQRPDDMTGMAYNGMLNTRDRDTQGAARYFDAGSQGGQMDKIGAARQGLDSSYGVNAVNAAYSDSNWGQELAHTVGYTTTAGWDGLVNNKQTGAQFDRGADQSEFKRQNQ